MATGTYPFANPETHHNQAALQTTRLQLEQALQLAAEARAQSPEVLAALITALALNKQSLTLKPKG